MENEGKKEVLRFQEFDREPLLIKFMGGMCSDEEAYRKYQKSFKAALAAVREAVDEGIINEEGRRLLKKCRG